MTLFCNEFSSPSSNRMRWSRNDKDCSAESIGHAIYFSDFSVQLIRTPIEPRQGDRSKCYCRIVNDFRHCGGHHGCRSTSTIDWRCRRKVQRESFETHVKGTMLHECVSAEESSVVFVELVQLSDTRLDRCYHGLFKTRMTMKRPKENVRSPWSSMNVGLTYECTQH